MRPLTRIALSALVLAAVSPALRLHGQAPQGPPQPPQERVIVPVYTPEPIPGVNGASWTTDLWIANQGTDAATVFGVFWDCMIPECGFVPALVDPGRTFQPHLLDEAGAAHGEILYLEQAAQDDVRFGLRFRDLSRQGATWGTELPVPREEDFRRRFSLVDVPVEEGFRQTLRIYSLDRIEDVDEVIVRVYRLDPSLDQPSGDADQLLGTSTLSLAYAPLYGSTPIHPGYAEVTDLSTLAPLGDAQRIRLEIEPVAASLRLWAFVTVIHNDTQNATVITPQ